VVLGGLGHLPGVILGAVLLAALPEVLRYVASPLQAMTGGRLDAAILRQLLIALAMIGVMLLRPRGLWPAPEHGKSLQGRGERGMSGEILLQVNGVSKRFGGLQALSDVGLRIERGQVYGLIGPNGAGKTTFFNVITGLYTPDSGTFELAGRPYRPSAVHEVAQAGIARTFQNIRLFADMTALENVMVGRHIRSRTGLLGAIFRTPPSRPKRPPSRSARTNCWPTSASASWPTTRRAR